MWFISGARYPGLADGRVALVPRDVAEWWTVPTIRTDHDEVHFADGVITAAATDDTLIDTDGLIVSPGFIDIQINGGFGHDFTQDPTTIWEVGRRLPELGVTSFVPTIVTSPDDVTDLSIDVVAHRKPANYRGAEVLGLHFEGPWISPEMYGAHNADHIVDPDIGIARKWADTGVVRIVTLAPEIPGATQVGHLLSDAGVVVSLGHTNADHDAAAGALETYASLATHLFNQMSPFTHRDPGTVGATLLSDEPAILIVDGLHLSDGAVRLAWKILGQPRTVLVTDAMAALGLGPGTYRLGDGPITVDDDGPRTSDGRLAGTVVTLPEAVANLQRAVGCTFPEALATASLNPARVLSLHNRGTLHPASRADIVVLDPDLHPVRTIVSGETLYSR